MISSRSLGALVVGLGLVLGLVVVAPGTASAASDPVRTSKKCNPAKYKSRYPTITKDKRAVITHLHPYALPPSSSHQVTKTATEQTTLKAAVTYDSKLDLSVSVAKKILASASASAAVKLMASGSRTVSKSVTVTDTVENRTKHNMQFVFFRGNLSAKGTFRHYYCGRYYTPTGTVGDYVYYRTGAWRSFSVFSDGAAACGAGGAVNVVTKRALAEGC